MARTKDRIYRLLTLIYPWQRHRRRAVDARSTATRAAAPARPSTSTTSSTGQLRKRIMPLLEDMPLDEKVRRGNVLLKTRPRDVEETLLQLINDDDQVVAAAGHRHRRAQQQAVGARRRRRARARAPRRARLVCVRGGVVGAGRAAHAGRAPARAVARAAAGRGARRAGCASCRSSRRSASTSCSASPAPRGRSATSRARVLLQEGVGARDASTSCSTAA